MDTETTQQSDQAREEEDAQKTPETTGISTPLENNLCGNENNSFVQNIKEEPQDLETNVVSNTNASVIAIKPAEKTDVDDNVTTNNDSNANEMQMAFEQQESNDTAENVEANGISNKNEIPNIETPMEVRVIKEEPQNDEIHIDSDMPIAKDVSYLSTNVFATPLPTSDFLDGIATAIAPTTTPRLRVKSELSLRQPLSPQKATPESKQNDDHITEEAELPPPPPPLLSSNSTLQLLADGIATPRISLLALNRLKVKTELTQPDDNDDQTSLPAEYFNDLLIPSSPKEAGEVTDSNSESDFEGIPADFFDDLLPEQTNKINEATDNNEREEKYSEKTKDKHRSHKKRKSKKKTRKRSRSRSPVHNKERDRRHVSPTSYNKEYKRSRHCISPNRNDATSSCSKDSSYSDELKINNSIWEPESFVRVKQEFIENEIEQAITPLENFEEISEILTPKQKREKGSSERLDGFCHWPVVDKLRAARACRSNQCKSRSRTRCEKCDVYLCLSSGKNCFKTFHTSE